MAESRTEGTLQTQVAQTTPGSPRRWLRRAALAVFGLLAADQAVQWIAIGRDGWLLGRRIAPFDPPLFTSGQYSTVARLKQDAEAAEQRAGRLGDVVFHPQLGWSTDPGSAGFGTLGERIGSAQPLVPHMRNPGIARVATFGCSFTFGSEVPGDESWPSQLAGRREDLEVLNFGVPGFGLDQALMRYRSVKTSIDVDEVWAGLLPATILRLLSCYRPILRHYTNTVATKPRFELADDELRLIPHAASSPLDLVQLIHDPQRFAGVVAVDGFAQRWPSAYSAIYEHPAHWFATSRLLITYLERGGRDWEASLRNPEDDAFVLARRIINEFAKEARGAGDRFRLLVLPDYDSLLPKPDRDDPWRRLVAALAEDGIDVVDLTSTLRAAGVTDIAHYWAENGHYAAGCNGIIAEHLDSTF